MSPPIRLPSSVLLVVLACGLLLTACASVPSSAPGPHVAALPAPVTTQDVVVPDCSLHEVAYFRCMLDSSSPGAVAVCGRSSADGVPTEVQVRLSAPDGTAVVVPARMQAVPGALAMDVVTRPQFSSQQLSFESEGRTWIVYSEHNVEFGPRPPSRGVRVSESRASGQDAWQCVGGAIDRLGELEPMLVSDVVDHG